MTSSTVEDYLKEIYRIEQREPRVGTTILAEEMHVAPATVTSMLKKLAAKGFATYERYHGVKLTEEGRTLALQIVRKHRIAELYLHEILGLPWEKVHGEAHLWEHALSEEVLAKMDEALGHPDFGPHGGYIPSPEGNIPERNAAPFSNLTAGQTAAIAEVNDRDPDILRYLGERGIRPGTPFRVVDVAPFNGPVTIEIKDQHHVLGRSLIEHIFVMDIQEQQS